MIIGTTNSMFENPSFIQKILKKKPSKTSSKYCIKPLYTSDIISNSPWIQTYSKKTKTYNIQSSSMMVPMSSSISTPLPSRKKRYYKGSEILIKLMDQKLLKRKQIVQSRENEQFLLKSNQKHYPILSKSNSTSTTRSKKQKYLLSLNNDEQDRLVSQHYLLRTGFGSDFNSPIEAQLEKGIVVLDVGCGPGTWTMEMSTLFPKSTFIGIDKFPFYPKDIKPRNCHFRTCDIYNEDNQILLPFPDNSIDYIYQRDMNWSFYGQTWQSILIEYQRILKPGGWIECMEPDLETQNSLENEFLMNDKLITGLTVRQQDPFAVHRLPTMLSINGFDMVETIIKSFSLGWQQNEFSRAMASQHLCLLISLKPWLSNLMNQTAEKYQEYITGLPGEWKKAKTFINWHCIIAQKPYNI